MSEWKKASEVLPAANETVVFLDKGAELDVGRYGCRCFNGINGTRHANGVDYWMSLPVIAPEPPAPTLTVKEALREAVEFIAEVEDSIGKIGFYGQRDRELTWRGNPILDRLRAALESEE